METTQKNTTVPALTLGDPAVFKNLTVFPLLGGLAGDPDYLTLDEALASGAARVTEVSAGGSVPELRFENLGDYAVLMLDGEELVGAKQNRTLNVSVLAPCASSITIPVTCIEAGRWSMRSTHFQTTQRMHHSRARQMKGESVSMNLRDHGARVADQGAVWQDIDAKMQALRTHSPTGALSDVFEQCAVSLDEYLNAFSAAEGQAGALFALNGEVVGLDAFDYQATFRRVLPKLLHSYALDAIEGTRVETAAKATDAVAFLDALSSCAEERYKALGEGEDVRLGSPAAVGAALSARGRTVHLSAFRRQSASGPAARLRRASQRANRLFE